MKKKKYAKGGFYGNEGGQQTSELLGQGIAGAANMIVPGAGAVLNVATGLTKMGMAGIDRLGPQAGDSYLGTDTRRMYDQSVDSGVANVLRNLAPIPGSIGQIAGITGSLLDMNKRKKHTEIPMVAGYAYGGPTYPVMQQDSLSPMMSSLFPPQNFYNGMPLPPQPLQVMNASIPSFDFLGASMGQGTAKQKSRDKIYEKAYGGDIPLSQDSFQVKGNPNTTDGNHYGNVSLDHDEVVKDNFVFSNKLFNPLTGETFAKEANRIEKSTGKIERRTASNPHDLIASNTLKQNEMMSNQLRNIQERVATQLGLRNDDGSTKQEAAYGGKLKYRNGGKTKGDPQPLIGTPQWFGNMASLGNGMSVPDYVTNQYANLSTNPYTGVLQGGINPIPYDMPAGPVANFDQLPSRNNYTNVGIPSGIDPWTGQASDNPTTFRGIDAPARAMPDVTKLNPFSGTPPTIPTSERSNPLKDWTLGDTLQAGSALSMFRGLGKGAYENPLYQDNTPISSNYVRPDSRLRSNSDSYNQATRSIDTNSANTFNSLQANLAASKYKADNQVLEGTNQMNRGYKQNYEQMLSQRLQQNQARAMQRDQQNLQSKAAYDQAMQAAFSTVNNFGQALNQKKEGKDSMAMLAKIFPQVYSGVFAKKYGGTIQTMFN